MPAKADLKRIPGGFLVAFEGIDGAGKTTQAKAVQDELQRLGYEAVYLREPTDGPIGQKLRQVMVSGRPEPMEEFRLFLADRTEDVEENIRPGLERGAAVCIDRYYISSIAYQGALGLDPEMIRLENEKIAPKPDLILYFRIPVEESLARIRSSRESGQNLFEKKQYQERVYAQFEAMRLPNMVTIDAMRDQQQLQDEIVDLVISAVRRKLSVV
jgi:dTMP kinase